LMEELAKKQHRKIVLKDWGKMAVEIAKWAVVLWLLWPLRHATSGPVDFTRAVVGILLFIIFAGKLFYDTVIMGILQQRRMSVKQDVFTLIGIVLVLSLVVGLLFLFVGFLLVRMYEMSRNQQEG